MVMVFAVSMGSVSAVAADSGNGEYPSPEDFIPGENFELLTREEYITVKAEANGISYEEAEAILDENIQNAIAALPSPAVWEPGQSIQNPNTTVTIYGRIYQIYTHSCGMKAIYSVQATMIASHYGANWAECDASTCAARPYGDGHYTFTGDCTARITSTTTIFMTLEGYFEIEREIANSIGIDLGGLSFGGSTGDKSYYRANVEGE